MPLKRFASARPLILIAAVLAVFALPASASAFGTPMVSTGSNFSCALNDGGTELCWGSSSSDLLGATPAGANLNPIVMPGGAGAVDIDTGYSTSCALQADTTVKCWGEDWNGELGRGIFTADSPDAVAVTGLSGVKQIESQGANTVCAVLADATATCWGAGAHKALGNNSTSDATTPVAVAGVTNVAKIVPGGGGTTCALIKDGTIKCWGYNQFGQVGNNTAGADVGTPATVSGISNAVDIAVGNEEVCALLATSQVMCWGSNFYGTLGTGESTGTEHHTPVVVPGAAGATQIVASNATMCALIADGTVRCWGIADTGQTGTGTDAGNVMTPTTVPGVSGVAQLPKSFYDSVCVMLHGGAVNCWGANNYFQAGIGPVSPIVGPHVVANLALISARPASNTAVVVSGKPKLDKKHKYFTLTGLVNATPDPIVVAGTACTGSPVVTATYTVVKYKTVKKHGKKLRKKVKTTRRFQNVAPLGVVQNWCSGTFTTKLRAKPLARKRLALSASFAGNSAMQAFTTPTIHYTMPKLPKAKKKHKK